MGKVILLFSVLFITTSFASESEMKSVMDNRSIDLRYCLDLPTFLLIAKCAGDVSPGKKGIPFTKEEVARITSAENAKLSRQTEESPVTPVPINATSNKDLKSDEE